LLRNKETLIYTFITILLSVVIVYIVVKLLPFSTLLIKQLLLLLTPFLLAALISYLLAPIVKKLTEFTKNRAIAIAIIYATFFLSLALLFYFGYWTFIEQLEQLSEQLPQLIALYEQFIYRVYESTSYLPEVVHDQFDEIIIRLESSVELTIGKILTKLTNVVQQFITIAVIPVLVFYFLKDFPLFSQRLRILLPAKWFGYFQTAIKLLDQSLGSYLRGQIIISSIVMAMTFIIYYSIQLQYSLVLAVIMGCMNIIPYFGPIIGTIPALSVALTTSWKIVTVVLATTLVVQIIEGTIFSPYIMGKSVRVHPIFIIFALLTGAKIAGIIGMLVAVPIVTIIRSFAVYIYLSKQHCN